MNDIKDIKDYPWPLDIKAVGLIEDGFPYLVVQETESGLWYYAHDFAQGEDASVLDEPDFIVWVRP